MRWPDSSALLAGMAMVIGLGGCSAGVRLAPNPAPATSAAPMPLPAGALDAARLAAAAGEPDQWFTTGRDASGAYYSSLADINAGNVARLGFAWEYRLGSHRGLEATPLVIDGVMYAAGNFGHVYALDAASGRELWTYDPQIDGQWGRYACCDAVNRGVAVWKGRVYVGALDGYLHAIDAASGKRLWKVDTLPARGPKTPYTLSAAPVIAGDLVIVGSAGADFDGARGYVAAYDLDSGAFRWRFYTVPRDPKAGPQDQPHLVDALKSWDPRHQWESGGGGTVWDGISYDPELKLLYIGTANGAPYNIKLDGRVGGDDLYTAAIVAIHADTGQLAWYYQTTPGDRWDYDSTQKMILADLDLGHGPRKVLMQASKNGYYYVLDRATGALLSARNFTYVNWSSGIDAKTGRPVVTPQADYQDGAKLLFPANAGAHSWQPMSYDPQTQLTYIPTLEWPMVYFDSARLRAGIIEGFFTVPAFPPEDYDPQALASLYGPLPPLAQLDQGFPPARSRGYLRAWDPVHQRLAWEVPTLSNWDGGVLSTGGGLVFQGDGAGYLNVYSADRGQQLAHVRLGTGVMAAPMTYRIGATQYVAVMAGYGGDAIGYPLRANYAAYSRDNEGRIIALKLDGGAVPQPQPLAAQGFPTPPAHEGTPQQIASGEVLYNRYCSRCHQLGPGLLPDLRTISAGIHQAFYDIVLKGALAANGMARWDDVLSRADAESIHAYLIDESWKAHDAQAASAAGLAAAERPAAASPTDARIAAALREISGARIRADIAALVGFGTRSTLSAQDPQAIAAGHGIGAAREWIRAQFEQYSRACGGCLEVQTDGFTQPPGERIAQPTDITNVYAVLKGSDPAAMQRVVLVSGHYDSRNSDNADIDHDAPGANDDASGVAVSLECARVLSALKFPATIVFLTVAGEEQGLYGSEHFARRAREQNWNIEAVLNNDIVGGDRSPGQDPRLVRVFSEGLPHAADDRQLQQIRERGTENDSSSRQLARYVADTAARFHTGVTPLLISRQDRYLRGGDHAAFNQQGYAAVRFTEYRENFNRQHQTVRTEEGVEYGDTPEHVDVDYVARVARLNAATLAGLAAAPAAPGDVAILTSRLENDSTLEWLASPGASSYEVLWRATRSADWEHARSVGSATRVTLPLSKDNVIFAVRAIDAQGHRSLAVVPEPKR